MPPLRSPQALPSSDTKSKPSLMSLPPELRDMILCRVLGEQKVHVHYIEGYYTLADPSGRVDYYIPRFSFCCVQPATKFAESSQCYVDTHAKCYAKPGMSPSVSAIVMTANEYKDYLPQLKFRNHAFEQQLSVLTVSKRLREESIKIFYSTNTFSVADSTSFNLFISKISRNVASSLRKMEFVSSLGSQYMNPGFVDSYGKDIRDWHLTGGQEAVLSRLQSIEDITIEVSDTTRNLAPSIFTGIGQIISQGVQGEPHRYNFAHGLAQGWLENAFGDLRALGNVKRATVRVLSKQGYYPSELERTDRVDEDAFRAVEMGFTAEILRHGSGMW